MYGWGQSKSKFMWRLVFVAYWQCQTGSGRQRCARQGPRQVSGRHNNEVKCVFHVSLLRKHPQSRTKVYQLKHPPGILSVEPRRKAYLSPCSC